MDRPLKILQISTCDLGGGAEGSAWNLFQAYRARGHQSWLAVGTKFSADPDVIEIPRPWRVQTWLRLSTGIRRMIDRSLGREDFNYPGTWQLLRLFPERPDIIHTHNLHGGYFDLRFLVPLSRQVPVILNLRDMWLLTGHCSYSLECTRWRTGCGRCPDLSIYPRISRDATAFNWQRKRQIYHEGRFYVTAISQWLLDQVGPSMLAGLAYRLVANAIDLAVFRPGAQSQAREQLGLPVSAGIVMLTAHSPFKDYAMMETALRGLKKTDGAELVFVCLGKSADPLVLGEGHIIYPGFERNPERIASYYRAADVFIHAAKAEAFGKTIAEATACGTPVVATAVGGIPELLEDGVTGYLVPKGDSDAMRQRVQQLLDHPALSQQRGARAAIVARRRFDLNRQVQEFLDWYQEILAREQVLGPRAQV